MLQSLSISNYALIQELEIDFSKGLSMITGETGAGKSILLGALGLVLGQRADSNSLKNLEKKCVVEAVFQLSTYKLEALFESLDLDYEEETIIRREILPSGKSRAFVNDSPVTLQAIQGIKSSLLDIHSQHQNNLLSSPAFLFQTIDAFAKNGKALEVYKDLYRSYKLTEKELKTLEEKLEAEQQAFDFNSFLFEELEKAQLKEGELEQLELDLDLANNATLLKDNLLEVHNKMELDELGLLSQLNEVQTKIAAISSFSPQLSELNERLIALTVEAKDLFYDIADLSQKHSDQDLDPEIINQRLQLLYDLLKKHQLSEVKDLIEKKEALKEKVLLVQDASGLLEQKKKALGEKRLLLEAAAEELRSNRTEAIPNFEKEVMMLLDKMGMPNAQLKVVLNSAEDFLNNGKDQLKFMFSANKGGHFDEVKKVASGGEMARLMLAIKTILSAYMNLPTILFDEIDTGVSGEVSIKMAELMEDMAQNMQVITITHLPQIAAKGDHHFKVYKADNEGKTATYVKALNKEERIVELAEILGGKNLTQSAIDHAKELLELK